MKYCILLIIHGEELSDFYRLLRNRESFFGKFLHTDEYYES